MMFTITLAQLGIGIEHLFPEVKKLCRDYCTEDDKPAFTVRTSEESIAYERENSSEQYSDGYLETLSVYRMIGTALPCWNGFIFHASVIELDGKAYAFAAKSGTGKTTHISHWRTAYGSIVRPVNGDKPILRFIDGVLYACGTPWAGKEGLQRNICVPLAGLCFLKRGEQNRILPIDAKKALPEALSQIFLPKDPLAADKTLYLLDILLRKVPLWELECTNSLDAAIVAKEAMTENRFSR